MLCDVAAVTCGACACKRTGMIAVAHGSSRVVRTSQPPTDEQGRPLFPHPVLLPTGETAAWFASLSVCESGVL